MQENSASSNWNKDLKNNTLSRETALPSGLTRKEVVSPSNGTKTITDTGEGASRVMTLRAEDSLSESEQLVYKLGDRLFDNYPIEMIFDSPLFASRIAITKDSEILLQVRAKKERQKDAPRTLGEQGLDIIKVEYNESGLFEIVLQAERAPGITLPEINTWEEGISLLVPFAQDIDEIDANRRQQLHENFLPTLGSKEQVEEVVKISNAMMERIYKSIPPDDRGEKLQKLDRLGLRGRFESRIFGIMQQQDSANPHEVISQIGEDEFIRQNIILSISQGLQANHVTWSRFLEITDFTEEDITVKEVEKGTGYKVNEEREMGARKFSSEGKVMVQNHIFNFSRQDGLLVVMCTTLNGRERWTAKIPTKIPYEDVMKKAKYLGSDNDFREIENSLGFSFTMASAVQS